MLHLIKNLIADFHERQLPQDITRRELETLVFLQLLRKNRDVYYFAAQAQECDFLVTDRGHVSTLIQVCYALDERNRDREIKGLTTTMKATGRSRGLLLTYNDRDQIDTDAGAIQVLPTWEWLLA